MERNMTIRELITLDIDIDVCNDVTDDWEIAFVGPVTLTEAGKNYFAEVLDIECVVEEEKGYPTVTTVLVDGPAWEHKNRIAEEFFQTAAGYCADSDYRRWFEE